MLKGLHPALNADVLYALRAMGHGDTLVICDTNFPAQAVGSATVIGQHLTMENLSAPDVVKAVLSVFPLEAAARMEVIGEPATVPAVQAEVQAAIDADGAAAETMRTIERFAFYDEAREAFAVIQTGETRFYGCFILTKGVIPPTN